MRETAYQVVTVREGKTYAVYRVAAIEMDETREFALAIVTFHDSMREIRAGAPELHAKALPAPDRALLSALRRAEKDDSMANSAGTEWPGLSAVDNSGLRWLVRWCPEVGGSLESPTAHLAALGFLSDLRFVWAGLASHRANHETAQIASLDHQIYFHQPSVDATAIHLYEMDSPYAAFGRTLVRGHIWELKSKRLVASTVQEGVLRVNCASSLGLPPNKGRIRGRL